MARYILYSDFVKSVFSTTTSYPLTASKVFSVKENSGMVWFGAFSRFGKIEKSTGTITYFDTVLNADVRGIDVSEADDIIILMLLNSSAKLVIEIRRLSNPTELLSTYTDTASGYSGGFDSVNKKIYVAYGASGVKIFNYNTSTHAVTVNTTIAIDANTWYDAKVAGGKLFISNVSNGTVKSYTINNGAPVTLTFIKDITATRPQGRGIWFSESENVLFVSHGTASNSVTAYDYSTGELLSENFITGANQPFGIHVTALGELWTASFISNSILKSV